MSARSEDVTDEIVGWARNSRHFLSKESHPVVLLETAYRGFRAIPRPEATDLVHHVDPGFPAPEVDAVWGVERRHLRPLPSPRDPSTWEDCVFKPGELVS